jgi:hypothetical protein
MKDIKTEIIDTTKQVGDLVDWLILRHSPPEPYEPTTYIDLEGVNLCREGSLSILTLLIDTGSPTMSYRCIFARFTSVQHHWYQREDAKGYPS